MINNNQNFVNIIDLPDDFKSGSADEISSSDFESLLNELNKQVSNADGSINELMRRKDAIEKEQKELDVKIKTFNEERADFEKKMKEEHDILNNLKEEFEQEKKSSYDEIQEMRDELSRKTIEFEHFRQEQLNMLKESKKALTNNYKQFEKIVATFNEKIDNCN